MQTLDPVRPTNKLANNNQKNIDHESPRYHIPHNQNTVGGGKQNHYESANAFRRRTDDQNYGLIWSECQRCVETPYQYDGNFSAYGLHCRLC